VDAHIRDLGGNGRANFARVVSELRDTLRQYARRRFLIGGGGRPILVWLCRQGSEPSPTEMRYQSEVACLAMNVDRAPALVVSFERRGTISGVNCGLFGAPSPTQDDYAGLLQEAERQRGKFAEFDED